jgi:hypothetical protein
MTRDDTCREIINDSLIDLARNASYLRSMYDVKLFDINRMVAIHRDLTGTHRDLSNVMHDLMTRGNVADGSFKAAHEIREFTQLQCDVIGAIMSGRKVKRYDDGV